MKKNIIKPRRYQHEKTLFINPAKKKIIKSINPKVSTSFLIVAVVFFSLIVFSAKATNQNEDWELWYDDDYTYIDSWGSISKSDLMALSIDNNNCEVLHVDFYITSFDREIANIGKKFNAEITETPHEGESWREYKNEIYVSHSEKRNGKTIYILSFNHTFETYDWINRLNEFDPFYFYLSISEHSETRSDPSIYFEHTDNLWDMKELKDILKKAYRNCRFKIYTEIEL